MKKRGFVNSLFSKKMRLDLVALLISFLLIVISNTPSFATDSKTVVYYFWKKPRCVSCINIENYTKEALDENFASKIKDGSIEYKIVDFSQKENKHFGKKYGLYTKTVILSKQEEGKEIKNKNLTQIWMKLRNKKDFKNYIKEEITKFIK